MAEVNPSSEYRLRLGKVVVSLHCEGTNLAGNLAGYFDRPSDVAEPDVRLELHIDHAEPPAAVPNSLILTKTAGPGGFDIADGLVRGRYDPATGRGDLTVQAHLLAGRLMRVFEQVLYQAFHAARQRTGYDACLVHSCGVIRDGRGYLFVGAAGSGKSTVAELSREHAVLNDEMNLIEFRPAGPVLVGVPFNGFFTGRAAGEAPLAAILLLSQADRAAVSEVGEGEAASAVAAQVAPPVALDGTADSGTSLAMLETAFRLVGAAPVRRLAFRRDPDFWQVIPEEMP